jgi:hypothetical protein
MVGAVVAVFLLAILYEGLKTLREYLVFMDWQHSHRHKAPAARCAVQGSGSESDEDEEEEERNRTFILAKKRSRVTSRRRKGYVWEGIQWEGGKGGRGEGVGRHVIYEKGVGR